MPFEAPGDSFYTPLLKYAEGTLAEVEENGSIETYLYPFTLFPDGSRFAKFQIKGTLLCADYNASGFGALFQLHTENTLSFAGQPLGITEEARNKEYRKFGARLVVGETDSTSYINGIHLMLPGKGEVWLSHAGH